MRYYARIHKGSPIISRYTERQYALDQAVGFTLLEPIEAETIQEAREKFKQIRDVKGGRIYNDIADPSPLSSNNE